MPRASDPTPDGAGLRPIVLVDIQERERDSIKRVNELIRGLNSIPKLQRSETQKDRLGQLEALVNWAKDSAPPFNADPLYGRLNRALADMRGGKLAAAHADGQIPPTPNVLNVAEKHLVAVYGILELDGADPGDVARLADDLRDESGKPKPELSRKAPHGFEQAVSQGLGEYCRHKELFEKVWQVFLTDTDMHVDRHFRADHWVGVVRTLDSQGVDAEDPLLPLRVQTVLSTISGSGGPPPDGTPLLSSVIDLPDLERQADTAIQGDNLQAMQAVYFCAMLDELKVFQVVDKLVEQAHYGLLPIGKGRAGHLLYRYWKQGQDRLTELERRSLYARTLGLVGGDASQTNINTNFHNLWMRFVSAVSSFYRQIQIDTMFRTATPVHLHQEQVRKAARDLAGNLSLYGFGITFYAAAELQNQINEIIQILSDREILSTYGSRDMYQLIDQVASLELGGAKNSIRYRTMAQSGATIIRWLSLKAPYLSGYSTSDALNMDQICGRHTSPDRPMVNPSDYDVVNACEQWLAVNGIPEQQVEEYSRPYEAPATTTRPINVPSAARDVLEAYGVPAGLGRGNGHGNPTQPLTARRMAY